MVLDKQWISSCISIVQFLVLVNGSLAGCFGSTRCHDPNPKLGFRYMACLLNINIKRIKWSVIKYLQIRNQTVKPFL